MTPPGAPDPGAAADVRPGPPWRVLRRRGSAGALHLDSAARLTGLGHREVHLLEAVAPAVVLGSSQPEEHLDAERLARSGLEVARRRSGGGAVLVAPGDLAWIDLFLPAGDPLWDADIGRAAWWVGDAWERALARLGVAGGAGVWRGGLRRTRWSGRVCFAGLGAGEVTLEGAKVVGVAQRRVRGGALFQCAALVRWDLGPLLDVLALEPAERAAAAGELAGAGRGVAVPVRRLEAAFVAALPGGSTPGP